jgi:hypothetical protein
MMTFSKTIKTVGAVALATILLLGPVVPAQANEAVGGECTSSSDAAFGSPWLVCKETKINGKKVFRWTRNKFAPPPKDITGLRRCMWGQWVLTAEAFGAYWESAWTAIAQAAAKDGEPKEPGEITDALADPSPVVWDGAIGYEFQRAKLTARGTIVTEGYTVQGLALMPYRMVGKSQVRLDPSDGNAFALFVVTLAGAGDITYTPEDFEPIILDVACSAKSLTLTIPIEGTGGAKVVLVRPPA